VFGDGPAPLGLRFQVNSAAVVFEAKPWFEQSDYTKRQINRMLAEKNKSFDAEANFQNGIIADEDRLRLPNFSERAGFKDIAVWRDESDKAKVERLKVESERHRRQREAKRKTAYIRLQ
jgi:hypothetical protein